MKSLFKGITLSMAVCIGQIGLLNAQTEPAPSLLFSLEGIEDVVSMYTDETAQTFYLHTDSILYTVSRSGKIISSERSKVKWACREESSMYIHEEGKNSISNEKGDTILFFPDEYQEPTIYLKGAKPMFRKSGIFYWWFGGRDGGGRSDAFFMVTEEKVERLNYCPFPCRGLVLLNDNILLFTYVGYQNETQKGFFSFFSINDPGGGNPYQLPLAIDLPVGLSLVEKIFYIWSNETNTMYTIPQSYFDNILTNIQKKHADSQEEPNSYDLTGRSADGTQKGVFVRDGKKVLVK